MWENGKAQREESSYEKIVNYSTLSHGDKNNFESWEDYCEQAINHFPQSFLVQCLEGKNYYVTKIKRVKE